MDAVSRERAELPSQLVAQFPGVVGPARLTTRGKPWDGFQHFQQLGSRADPAGVALGQMLDGPFPERADDQRPKSFRRAFAISMISLGDRAYGPRQAGFR